MKRLKTFATYLVVFILFFVLSRVLIFIGLNNTYDNISLKGSTPQGVSISSAKATSVNGEIRGKISSEELNSKHLKFNFYTDIDTLAGSYYITPSELENGNFEFYFKLNYIESYSIEITDEKPETVVSESFSPEKYENHVVLTSLILLIFL